jgi:hypothetical protein
LDGLELERAAIGAEHRPADTQPVIPYTVTNCVFSKS